jgi:hypothetical protein
MRRRHWQGPLAIAAMGVFLCVLGFYRTTSAQQPAGTPPFANSVEQRQEIIEQLKELNQLVKQQNDLLQNGKLRVIVTSEKQE